MTFDEDKDELVFSNGDRRYCRANIIGINDVLDISYGYDGSLDVWPAYDFIEDCYYCTPEQAIELADLMIEHWTRYRDKAIAATKDAGG